MEDMKLSRIAKAIHKIDCKLSIAVPDDWYELLPATRDLYMQRAIAAVRAHNAGTDEGLRKARVQDAFDKIASANTVTICSLDEMESIVNRALDGEFDADLRVPPASHAAESVSTAQLDAEDLVRAKADNIVALETICRQQHEALDRMDTEMIYIHEIAADDRSYSPEKKHLFASDEGRACLAQSKEALTAYAALFPKTGGAK